jgi:hypothetical protein
MAMTQSTINRAPRPSSLADVLDLILDKGLVIDAYVRVSLVGIEILTIDARVVVASVDTYLRFAEAVNRLDLRATETPGIPALLDGDDDEEGGSSSSSRQSGRSQSSLPKGRDRGTDDDGSDDEDDSGLLERIVERGRRK